MNDSTYFVPILTKNSIKNQWVNQEIGFARALQEKNKIICFPIVENAILNSLKGFIHKQLDLSFTFTSNRNSPHKERASYRKCSEQLSTYLYNLARLEEASKKKISDDFLKQQVDYDSLLTYANKKYENFKRDDHSINQLLWRDLRKNKYKTLGDIDQVIEVAKPAIEAYYKDNPSLFISGTDFLTKSLGFVDEDFRSKHPFGRDTRNAFVRYSNLLKQNGG